MSGETNTQPRPMAAEHLCPAVDALVAFASGKLSEAELATIADHVSRCETCESAVRSLSSQEDSLAGRLRAAVQQVVPLEEPACLRMQEAAQAIAPVRDESATAETEMDAGTGESHSVLAKRQVTATATATWSAPLPATIGRYQVRSELGSGGFGSVYLAYDPDLERPVAIKVPRFDAAASEGRIEAFLQEARTAARLKHPGIVAVYEVGRQPDNTCYIVMEYVEGKSLAAEMAAGKLPVKRVVEIVRQAAAAVHYAHKKGLVHRDLKPANILLDAEGQVKIADFGLAVHEDQQRSRAGELAGTLGYMSPEQVRRDVHRLDGRSDIWALGVILYELLTGRRPFAGTKYEVADEIQHRSPKPPRQIDDTIPPELERVCLKCLAKDPEQRYTSAGDVAGALLRDRRRTRIGALVAAVSALVALLLIAGFWPMWLLGIRPKQSEQIEASSEKPTRPLQVDALAEPFVWFPLLSRHPFEPFPGESDFENHPFDAKKQEVLINSPVVTFLTLGETASPDYRLQVEMYKTAPAGHSGIFFGMQELPRVGDRRRLTAQCIWLICQSPDSFLLQRDQLDIIVLPNGEFGLSTATESFASVPSLVTTRGILEITVNSGRLDEVRWMDVTYPALAAGPQVNPAKGQFGIINRFGATLFRDGRIKLRSSE